MRCGSFEKLVLDKLGIRAFVIYSAGWGHVARRDRLATIFPNWLASPAGIAFKIKNAEAKLRASASAPNTG